MSKLKVMSNLLAQDNTIQLNRPTLPDASGGPAIPVGYSNIGNFVNNLITLMFIVATVIVLFMLVWGAIQWIFSGGDKDAVKAARDRIIHALVGFAVLAVAFAVAVLAGQFLGFNITQNLPIPTPSP